MGNSNLRQQREFPDDAGALHLPQSGCVSRARPAGQKARPAGQRTENLYPSAESKLYYFIREKLEKKSWQVILTH